VLSRHVSTQHTLWGGVPVALYNILVVDDEVNNLNALERTFRREYNVFSATRGEDALSIMEQNDIVIIITDQRMPGMTGVELLEKTAQKYPDTVRIILTAYTDADGKLLMDAVSMGYVHSYIAKPWEPEEVKAAVRESIEAYEAARGKRAKKRKRIGEILVEHDLISESQLATALELQKSKEYEGKKLGEILVDLGYTDEESIIYCYALQLGMPYVSLSQLHIKPELPESLPSELACKYSIIPIDKVGRVLVVATSEPLSDKARSEIEEKTGCRVKAVCTVFRDIQAALQKYYPNSVSADVGIGKRENEKT
jgi:CheY-like chemotaxis protein